MCVEHTRAHMDASETRFPEAGLHAHTQEDGATVRQVNRSSRRGNTTGRTNQEVRLGYG